MVRWTRLALMIVVAVGLPACGSGTPIDPPPCTTDCPPPPPPPPPEIPGTWSQAASMPTARREMPAALLDGRIYVTGGLRGSEVLTTVEVYDPVSDRWTTGPPLPAPRHHHGAVGVGGKLYVIGGYQLLGALPWVATGTVWELDPASGVWRERAPMSRPRAAMAVAASGGKIYVFGGADGGRDFATTLIYDPSEDRWTEAAPMPTSREHVAAVALDGTIYVLGGRRYWDGTTAGGGNERAVEAYTPATDSWQPLARMELGRSGHGVAVLGGKIYSFGGEVLAIGAEYDSVEEYDPATDHGRSVRSLPERASGLAAVGLGDRIHVIGGSRNPTQNLVFRIP